MIVIGLTGGIASGKSYVAGLFGELGAVVLDADRHAHAALAEPAVVAALSNRWGAAVLDTDGALRRSEIAARVFGASEKAAEERRFLEQLIHPRVRARLQAELSAAEQRGAAGVVLDIPLLLEAGWADRCDKIVFVETPEATRTRRATDRGWKVEDLRQREAAQLAVRDKRQRSDAIVPGDDPDLARTAVKELWHRLVGVGGSGAPIEG